MIFLGFGYLPKNVERLQLNEHRNERTRYFGTAVDLYGAERDEKQQLFPPRHSGQARIALDPTAESPDVLTFIRNHLDLFKR